MSWVLRRIDFQPSRTFGKLYVDDAYFCDVLEDTDRGLRADMPPSEIAGIKVQGKTAIPYGTYRVTFEYSPRFHRDMLTVCDVQGFSGIRIHAGNTEEDTEGCLLLGKRQGNKLAGGSSRPVVAKLEAIAHNSGEVQLQIVKV